MPLVGYAKLAIDQALIQADDEYLLPQNIKADHCHAAQAPNAVNKWLKKDFSGGNIALLKTHVQRSPEGTRVPYGYDRPNRWVEISWWYRT